MAKMNADEVQAFLEAPRLAHVTTLRTDGSPVTSPVWYEYEDGVFYVFSPEAFAKPRNLRRDPRISICVASEDEPYRYVSASGEARVSEEGAIERASSIAGRYRGEKGPEYAASVDRTYGGLRIISLAPRRLNTWCSGD
jgi:PPOX class probable F420-dependent enzyme